jgi:hypothetical protein
MKCNEVQELFGVYFDVPAGDSTRTLVDNHVRDCSVCREEFEIWEQSAEWIRSAQVIPHPAVQPVFTTERVMSRIYAGESWRMPVPNKIYSIPYKIRRNLSLVITVCLAIFALSFLYSLTDQQTVDTAMEGPSPYGFHQAASASSGDATEGLNIREMNRSAVASASALIRPVKIGPIHTSADYFLALSLLGLVCTLLIMNWFSRTRV